MTVQDVKERRYRFRDAAEQLKTAQNNLEQMENLLTGVSIDYSTERVSSSPISFDRFGDQMDPLNELRIIFEEKKKEATERMYEATQLINLCTSARGYEILSRRYIQGETLDDIAEAMHYSLRQLYRIHADALIEIADACQ